MLDQALGVWISEMGGEGKGWIWVTTGCKERGQVRETKASDSTISSRGTQLEGTGKETYGTIRLILCSSLFPTQ
jgi:hypothetical protein